MGKARESKTFTASAAVLVALFGLPGCETSPTDSSARTAPTASAAPPVYAEVGLTPRQRYRKALEYLENGMAQQAEAELREYLIAQPNSRSATLLLRQINTPSSEYYPSESFPVTLSSGQSLSRLAEQYLGTALEFYALAKYNGIANPSSVEIGQTIQIPMTADALRLRQAMTMAETAPDPQMPGAEDAAEAIAVPVEEAVAPVEELVSDEMTSPVEDELLAPAEAMEEMTGEPELPTISTPEDAYAALQQSLENGDYAAAMDNLGTLQGLTAIDGSYRDAAIDTLLGYARSVEEEQPAVAALRLSEAAKLQLAKDDKWAALATLKQAVALDESDSTIAENLALLQKQMAEPFHREASSAFRRQELDIAIANWTRVLEIDPEHSSARAQLAQAEELKDRLDRLSER